jgi:hypothetical protein
MTAPTLRRTRCARALAGLFLALACALLTGCGPSGEEPSGSESAQAPETSDAPPFAVKLDGPETAGVGEEVTVTLTNVGRLPDAYQLSPEPLGAALIKEPDLHASPEESVDVTVRIKQTPVSIVVKSIGGGGGEQVGQVTID